MTTDAHDTTDDDGLVTAAVRGDVGAFGQLVERHQQSARRLASALVGVSDADDVTQDAFVRAYRSLATFRAGSPFRPWLLRIVARQAADHHRGSQRRARRHQTLAAVAGSASSAEPGDVVEQADRDDRVRAALATLPDKDRAVLTVRFLLDHSEAETAAILDCPAGTVKSRTARALEKLRAQIDIADWTIDA